MRRWICCFLVLALLSAAAVAELALPQDTYGEQALAAYVTQVNDNLISAGNAPVNSVFMCFPGVASLGVTDEDNAEIPEQVEMTFQMYATGLNTLQLRVCQPDLFGVIAAACIQAASPQSISMAEAQQMTQPYVKRVKQQPGNSFEDEVIYENGVSARTYFAYYPDQYHDGISWLQMTLVFPLAGYEGGVSATPVPTVSEPEDEYEGIDVRDSYTHFEVFVTATPEPDSPAGESDSGL